MRKMFPFATSLSYIETQTWYRGSKLQASSMWSTLSIYLPSLETWMQLKSTVMQLNLLQILTVSLLCQYSSSLFSLSKMINRRLSSAVQFACPGCVGPCRPPGRAPISTTSDANSGQQIHIIERRLQESQYRVFTSICRVFAYFYPCLDFF